MPEASNQVTINRPVAEVFAFLANAENDIKWRPGVVEMKRVSGDGVGTRYRQIVAGPGGRDVDADIEVTDLEINRRLGFKGLAGPVRPVGSYEFSGDGATTTVTFSLKAQLRGLKKLIAPMVGKTMNAEVAALAQLKHVLESAGS